MNKPKVAINRCVDYDEKRVSDAVKKSIDHVIALDKTITKGMNVLIKPNLMGAYPPEEAVTTHPSIVKSLVNEVKKIGATPAIGDGSFGTTNMEKVFETTGMEKVSEETGAELVDLKIKKKVKLPANDFLYVMDKSNYDFIISVPKLKTHTFMSLTGAVKNMFGCVPGQHKLNAHGKFQTQEKFAEALLDVCLYMKPGLVLMDGIIAMEGNGPAAGSPVDLGVLLASTDSVALDTVASCIVGYDPLKIPVLKIAHDKNIGMTDMNNIELVGDPINDFKKDIKKGQMKISYKFTPLINLTGSIKPVVDMKKCVKCGLCAQNCPVSAIDLKPYPKFDYNKCIRCFCCSEVCPQHAITPNPTLMLKLFRLLLSLRKI